MLNDKQIEELRKLILMEADQAEEAPQEQPQQEVQDNNQIEPTPEELYAALQNGEIDVDTIDEMHNNGQISDENYQALVDLINSEQAAEEETNPEEVIQSIVDAYLNGEITDEDIDKMLQNGEIDEDAYNQIIQLIQEQMDDDDVPQEEPQPIAGKYNQVKLFDYFIKLQKCIQLYMDTYKDIEMDQVSSFQMKGLYRAYKNITTLKNNLDFYMENNFTGNDYKENLTQYITLQRDFADELRKFRHILHLNPNKIIEQRKEEQEKNKKD